MKKLFAIVLSCSLIITAISFSGVALADNADEAENTVITQDSAEYERSETNIAAPETANLLKAQPNLIEYYENNSFTKKLNNGTIPDAVFDNVVNIGGSNPTQITGAGLNGSSIDQTDNYIQMQFRINGKLNNPERFIFAMHTKSASAAPGYNVKHYAVFVSSKYSELFNDSSKIIEVKDENNGRVDVINTSGLTLTDITYVAVRVYKTGHKDLFMTEMGFFGGEITDAFTDNAITEHTALSVSDFSGITAENQLAGSKTSAAFYKEGTELDGSEVDKEPNCEIYFDGLFGTDKGLGKWNHGDSAHDCRLKGAQNGIFQTDTYLQFQMELSVPINNPKEFVIAFHESKNGAYLRSQHYSVFASGSIETLYSSESKIIEITDENNRNGDKVDLSGKTELENIKYVGIRFYNRGYTADSAVGCVQHITEIGLYGGSVIGPMGDMNMDGNVDILDLVRLKKYNADSTVAIDTDNELLVNFEGGSAQLTALRRYLLTGSWYVPTLFANEGYTYVWGDEFNGDTLNSKKWESGVAGTDSDIICSNETNLTLADNSLNLRVYGETNPDGTTTYRISEGLRTHSTMNFQYGYLEMRVKAPIQSGVWPTFWLSGLNGPYSDVFKTSLTRDLNFTAYGTEIDILEQYHDTDIFYTSLHKWYPGAKNALKYNDCTYKFDGEYHIYGFKWTHDEMSVYVDGKLCYSYDLSDNFDKEGYSTTMDGFRSPHYLRITNGLDKAATGYDTPLTADVDCALSIDWIRLYQIPGQGGLWTK